MKSRVCSDPSHAAAGSAEQSLLSEQESALVDGVLGALVAEEETDLLLI